MTEVLFFGLSFIVLYGALRVVTHKNIVVGALHLASSMLALAGLFFILGAYFIASVQVLVYAGAVMVLFIMVVMLFDLKEIQSSLFHPGWGMKLGFLFFFTGLVAGVFPLALHISSPVLLKDIKSSSIKSLATVLFSDYILAFEVLGVLLLVIAVGVAVLCHQRK